MKLFSRITHSLGVQAMKNLKITYIAPCLIQRMVKKDTLQFLEFLLALHTIQRMVKEDTLQFLEFLLALHTIQRMVKKDTLQFLECLLALHTKTLARVVGLGDLSFSGVNDTYRMK